MSKVRLLHIGVRYSFSENGIWKIFLNIVSVLERESEGFVVDNLVASRSKCLSVLAMIVNYF